jgi:hypothetical protein
MDWESYDEMYDDVEAGSEFKEVPDGVYQVFIEEIALTETKKEPVRPMLAWQLSIMSGEHEGRKLFKNAVVNTKDKDSIEQSLRFIKTDLSVCGLNCKFSEIAENLDKLLNAQLEVKVVTKDHKGKPIQNIYIQRQLDAGEVVDPDDTPF